MSIIPTAHGIERAKEYLAEREERPARRRGIIAELSDFLEQAMGNGWSYVRPEDVSALTDATIISADGFTAARGEWMPHPLARRAKVYAHMSYQVEDPIETWATGKPVFFQSFPVEQTKEQRAEARKAWEAEQ